MMRSPHRRRRRRVYLLVLVILLAHGTTLPATEQIAATPSPPPPERDEVLEEFLRTAEVASLRGVISGVTMPSQVVLRKDGREVRAIFKTVDVKVDGKVQLEGHTERGFTDRWQYEIAAYRLDRLLGLGMVPATVFRNIAASPGSLQVWIEEAIDETTRAAEGPEPDDPTMLERQKSLMRVFDYLIHNIDRNDSNLLYTPRDGRLHLIDHSRAFRTTRIRPPDSATLAARDRASLVEPLRALDLPTLRQSLGELLTEEQIAAILERRDRLLQRWER